MAEDPNVEAVVPNPGPTGVPPGTPGPEGVSTSSPVGEREQGGEVLPKPAASPAPAPQEDWRDARIKALTAKKKELEARLASVPQSGQNPPDIEAEIERRAAERAKPLAQQMRQYDDFNASCEKVTQRGVAEFGQTDFVAKVENILKLVDRQDPAAMAGYRSFLAACIEAGPAEKIIHHLGSDLNEASRIMSMDPIRMGVALAKLSNGMTVSDIPSSAPKPITPITPRHVPIEREPDNPEVADKLATAEWMRLRTQQAEQRKIR